MAKSQPQRPSTSSAGNVPCNAGTGTCGDAGLPTGVTAYQVSAQWVDTQAYCGDTVRLRATVTPQPPNTAATVEVLDSSGRVLQTISTQVSSGTIEATWICKAPSANWRNERISFRVNVPSLNAAGTSNNNFTFRQRPTTGWVLRNVAHPSAGGFAPVHEKHDARLEADRVHYSLKLRTHGAPFGADKQNAAKTLIENVWNNGFANKKFHRTRCGRGRACDCQFDCCKAGFRLDVNFVTSGEHVAVRIVATPPGAPTYRSRMNGDGGEWGDPPMSPTTTYPHEVGHVLGQHDEYSTGATDPTGVQPANATTPNLMSTPGNTTLLNRHYRYALVFLNGNADGDPYEIIPPGE